MASDKFQVNEPPTEPRPDVKPTSYPTNESRMHFETTMVGYLDCVCERLDRQNLLSDRIIKLLENREQVALIAMDTTIHQGIDRIIKLLESISDTGHDILLHYLKACGPQIPPPMVPHYPLPGDPEPTTQPEMNPVGVEDRKAVERWQLDDTDRNAVYLADFSDGELQTELLRRARER